MSALDQRVEHWKKRLLNNNWFSAFEDEQELSETNFTPLEKFYLLTVIPSETVTREMLGDMAPNLRTILLERAAIDIAISEIKHKVIKGRCTTTYRTRHEMLESAVPIAAGLDIASSLPKGSDEDLRNQYVTFTSALFGRVVMGPEINGKRELLEANL